jgi:O-glycosyl hydrolase
MNFITKKYYLSMAGILAMTISCRGQSRTKGEWWVTSEDRTCQITRKTVVVKGQEAKENPVIHIDPTAFRQPILGFGGTFTDSDIFQFMRMSKAERTKALRSLFSPTDGAGWNLMRISFGSSDWDRDWHFYTYDDMPHGMKDDSLLSHFSVAEDRKRGHFELIKEALQLNPDLKIYAAVWGPPAWMKDNDKLISDGTILPEFYQAYALYLVKAIQAYEKEGIPILSLSPQNEPLCTDGRVTPQAQFIDWKTMRDMVRVIRNVFREYGIKTDLWIFDHNFAFVKGWVEPFISDTSNQRLFDGVAWHDYGGSEQELCRLAEKYPGVPMYLTERALYSIEGLSRILRIIRCGARNHNHWVTISDEYGGPYQWGGGSENNKVSVSESSLGALYNFRTNADVWQKTTGYYIYAQLARFVKRNARLIGSTETGDTLTNAAFRNPDGSIVLVVVNCGGQVRRFTVEAGKNRSLLELPARSAGTFLLK